MDKNATAHHEKLLILPLGLTVASTAGRLKNIVRVWVEDYSQGLKQKRMRMLAEINLERNTDSLELGKAATTFLPTTVQSGMKDVVICETDTSHVHEIKVRIRQKRKKKMQFLLIKLS